MNQWAGFPLIILYINYISLSIECLPFAYSKRTGATAFKMKQEWEELTCKYFQNQLFAM